jgi:lipopolysaccharide transport system ATP-binding protein
MNKRIFGAGYTNEVFQLNEISLANFEKSVDDPLIENEVIVLYTDITLIDKNVKKYHITYHLYN